VYNVYTENRWRPRRWGSSRRSSKPPIWTPDGSRMWRSHPMTRAFGARPGLRCPYYGHLKSKPAVDCVCILNFVEIRRRLSSQKCIKYIVFVTPYLLLPTTDIHTLMALDLSARCYAFKHVSPALSMLPMEWHQR